MKTVTMDWETYQAEIQASKDAIDEAFENGVKENQKRLDPIIDWCKALINKTVLDSEYQGHEVFHKINMELHAIMREAGEI